MQNAPPPTSSWSDKTDPDAWSVACPSCASLCTSIGHAVASLGPEHVRIVNAAMADRTIGASRIAAIESWLFSHSSGGHLSDLARHIDASSPMDYLTLMHWIIAHRRSHRLALLWAPSGLCYVRRPAATQAPATASDANPAMEAGQTPCSHQ